MTSNNENGDNNSHNLHGSNSNNNTTRSQNREIFTYKEIISPGLQYEMQLKRVYASTKSDFQDIDVVETCFGKTLLTDGLTQSAQFDEFAYHESLVHPALIQCAAAQGKAPQTVFIGGGGELATAREVLRHPGVQRVVMVDLDDQVVQVCKEYLPEWGGETVAQNERLELVIGDAHAYILNTNDTYDVIIMDISDPVEAGPGIALYTKEFYEYAVTKLAPGGVFVTQAGMASAIPVMANEVDVDDPMCFGPIHNTLASVFDVSLPYTTNIPSFGSDWGFVMAFNRVGNGHNGSSSNHNHSKLLPVETIDDLVEQHIEGGSETLKHYDGVTHCRMFSLTKPLRQYMDKEKRIMTKDNPIYMFNG